MSDEEYDIAWIETMAAAGWPDPFADEAAHEARMEREQAWYASPEGQAWQLQQARAIYKRDDSELPGMWERADFMGGETDA